VHISQKQRNGILAITVLDSNVYVVRDSIAILTVFSTSSFQVTQELKLSRLPCMNALASNEAGGYVIMTQLRPSQLFYLPDNQLMTLVNDSPLVVEPISVATTSRNTVLLLCRKPHVLQELTYPTFTTIHEVNLACCGIKIHCISLITVGSHS